ncbi:MAG TPA: hypothetical protein VKE69_11405 [Planctomycetota bacterium]|nr:hypothetical protein [Planctomycetota bacterium]
MKAKTAARGGFLAAVAAAVFLVLRACTGGGGAPADDPGRARPTAPAPSGRDAAIAEARAGDAIAAARAALTSGQRDAMRGAASRLRSLAGPLSAATARDAEDLRLQLERKLRAD